MAGRAKVFNLSSSGSSALRQRLQGVVDANRIALNMRSQRSATITKATSKALAAVKKNK